MVWIQPLSAGFLLIGTPLIGSKIPPPTTRPLRVLSYNRTFAHIMKNYRNVQNFIYSGVPLPPPPRAHPRQLKIFQGEPLLYRRQKIKRLPLTSSEAIFLNILCSKNFFKWKNRKASLKNLISSKANSTLLSMWISQYQASSKNFVYLPKPLITRILKYRRSIMNVFMMALRIVL